MDLPPLLFDLFALHFMQIPLVERTSRPMSKQQIYVLTIVLPLSEPTQWDSLLN